MTPAQKARLAGWNASLSKRGVLLTLKRTSETFNAIASDAEPVIGQFGVNPEERDDSFVSILRSDLGSTVIVPGDVFTNPETGAMYSVSRTYSRPSDIIARWRCESSLQ